MVKNDRTKNVTSQVEAYFICTKNVQSLSATRNDSTKNVTVQVGVFHLHKKCAISAQNM